MDGQPRGRETTEPDEAQLFVSQLAGQGGLELTVEIAHNLRSPLTSIVFLSEALLKGQSGGLSELQHRQLSLIYSAAMRLVSTIGDVIELAHGGDSLIEKRPSAFSVAELLNSICDVVRPMAGEKRLELRSLTPPMDRRVGYPAALSRVLLNLTTNAIKFTDEGYVEITSRPTGLSRVEFSVRDTGRGIDSASHQELFQPFRRDSASSHHGFSGTGLGLAICRRLVAAMHSELRYETAPDWGTRFFFEVELPPEIAG